MLIGVTGGIGSGKSSVCAMFGKRGVPVFDADNVAKQQMVEDESLRNGLIRLLGSDAYLSDGTLNRNFVASRLFSNKALQKKIEELVHPAVERELERWVNDLSPQTPFALVEAALIYEAGLEKTLDAVLVVDADEATRIPRIAARDGLPEAHIRRRMKAQWSTAKKKAAADYVIRNDGSIESLERAVEFLYRLFLRLAGERSS
jgi:dephospho-CoA kinase